MPTTQAQKLNNKNVKSNWYLLTQVCVYIFILKAERKPENKFRQDLNRSLVNCPRGNDEARGAKCIPEYRNFNSVYIVLEFLNASNVYQRRDVLLLFPTFSPLAKILWARQWTHSDRVPRPSWANSVFGLKEIFELA